MASKLRSLLSSFSCSIPVEGLECRDRKCTLECAKYTECLCPVSIDTTRCDRHLQHHAWGWWEELGAAEKDLLTPSTSSYLNLTHAPSHSSEIQNPQKLVGLCLIHLVADVDLKTWGCFGSLLSFMWILRCFVQNYQCVQFQATPPDPPWGGYTICVGP